MPIKNILVAGRHGKEYHTYDGYDGEPVLVTTTHGQRKGVFKVGTANTGITTVVTPDGDGAIVFTDLIVTSDKLNNGTISVDFYDGTYTETLVKANIDYGLTLAIPFVGHWEGWASADLRLVSLGAADAYIAVGYYKIDENKALDYAAWDARR